MITVGQQIGGYTVVQRLGQGGMGEVYLAQHRRVARRAAIKVLIPELSKNASIMERFFTEARATSLIRHPGIVEVIDCDVQDGQAYIVMELLEGESLNDYVRRVGGLMGDVPLILGVGIEVAGAVGAAHALGIIHRDLKPDNVYMHLPAAADSLTMIKVLDFGIAKLAQQGVTSQTSTGVLMGTPSYMSPEQCRGAGRVDARSDVYSLGCILYETVCGMPPFVREGMGDLIVAHVSEAPVPLVKLVRGLPAEIDAVIQRMLAKNPDERPQTMEEVARDLRTCATQLGMRVDPPLKPVNPVQRPEFGVPEPMAPMPSSPLSARDRGASSPHSAAPTSPQSPSARGGAGDASRLKGTERLPVVAPVVETGHTFVLPDALPPKETTTLGLQAGERAKRKGAAGGIGTLSRPVVLAGAGGAVVVAGLILFAALKPKSEVPSRTDNAAEAPADTTPARGDSTKTVKAAEAPSAVPVAPVVAKAAASENVQITFAGLPTDVVITLDGHPSENPVRLARGTEEHRIVARAPDGTERRWEVDGTQDRTFDVSWTTRAAPPANTAKATKAPAEAAVVKEAVVKDSDSDGHAKAPPRRGAAVPRTPHAGAAAPATRAPSDREAITDI